MVIVALIIDLTGFRHWIGGLSDIFYEMYSIFRKLFGKGSSTFWSSESYPQDSHRIFHFLLAHSHCSQLSNSRTLAENTKSQHCYTLNNSLSKVLKLEQHHMKNVEGDDNTGVTYQYLATTAKFVKPCGFLYSQPISWNLV